MDKENNNNIDDILRLLKDKMENSEGSDTKEEKASGPSLDAQSLKEKLREQFALDEPIQTEEIKDEYAIDESFAEEAEPEIESIVEAEAEVEDEPMVEAEPEIEAEPIIETEPEIEAEPMVEGESIVEAEPMVEVEAESTEATEFEGFEISPEYIAMLESLAEREETDVDDDVVLAEHENDGAVAQEGVEDVPVITVSEETVDTEDDAPWYDDEAPAKDSEQTLPIASADDYELREEQESLLEEYEEVQDEELFDNIEEAEDDLDETIEPEESLEITEDEVIKTDYADDDPEDLIDTVVPEFHEKAALTPEEIREIINAEMSADEKTEESFYRTMMDAEHETLARRAAQRELDEMMVDDTFEDSVSDGEYDFDGTEAEEIMNMSEDISDGDEGVEIGSRSKYEEKYGISTDFFAALNREDTPDPDEVSEHIASEIELDAEEEEAEQQIGKVSVWSALKPYAMGAIAFILLLLELLPVFEIVPDGILDYTEYGIVYVLFDIQLIAFMAVLYWQRLWDGFARLLTLTVNVYSVLAMTLLVTLGHSILACFCTADGMPYLYNSISAIYILASYVVDILDAKRVRRTISELIISDKVYALRRSHGKDSMADKMYLGGVAPDTNIYEPAEVKLEGYKKCFVNDREATTDKTVIYAMTPVVVFSALIAVSSMVFGNEFSYAINAMVVTFTTLAPLSAIISSFLPTYVSYLRLSHRGCIIASEKAATRIGDCDALVFGDRHLFKESDSKDNGIKIYNEHRASDVLACLDAVYGAIGGPMQNVFAGANRGSSKKKVYIVRITRNGIEAVVDDRVSVIIGAAEYLLRYGISTEEQGAKSSSGILYVAINSKLEAKLSLNYRTEPLFESLSELMGDNKISTVIGTYDPVISGSYVAYCRRGKDIKYPVSVVHKNKTDYYKNEKAQITASKSGAFVLSSRLKLVELAVFAKKMMRVIRYNSIIRGVLFGLSALLSVIFTVGGAMQDVNTLWVLLYHLIACASYAVVAIMMLPVAFDKRKTTENK